MGGVMGRHLRRGEREVNEVARESPLLDDNM